MRTFNIGINLSIARDGRLFDSNWPERFDHIIETRGEPICEIPFIPLPGDTFSLKGNKKESVFELHHFS